MKFAPQSTAGHIELALSKAACASAILEAQRLPPQRSGTPRRRASAPIAK